MVRSNYERVNNAEMVAHIRSQSRGNLQDMREWIKFCRRRMMERGEFTDTVVLDPILMRGADHEETDFS